MPAAPAWNGRISWAWPAVTPLQRRNILISTSHGCAALLSLAVAAVPALANSSLLDSVKQNPQQARALCSELKEFNSQGLSYTSTEALARLAARQRLSQTDAEILATYVVGLYCPDVR